MLAIVLHPLVAQQAPQGPLVEWIYHVPRHPCQVRLLGSWKGRLACHLCRCRSAGLSLLCQPMGIPRRRRCTGLSLIWRPSLGCTVPPLCLGLWRRSPQRPLRRIRGAGGSRAVAWHRRQSCRRLAGAPPSNRHATTAGCCRLLRTGCCCFCRLLMPAAAGRTGCGCCRPRWLDMLHLLGAPDQVTSIETQRIYGVVRLDGDPEIASLSRIHFRHAAVDMPIYRIWVHFLHRAPFLGEGSPRHVARHVPKAQRPVVVDLQAEKCRFIHRKRGRPRRSASERLMSQNGYGTCPVVPNLRGLGSGRL